MSLGSSIDWVFQSTRQNRTNGGKTFDEDSIFANHTTDCHGVVNVIEVIIRLVIAVGFVCSLCTLSCSVKNASLGDAKDKVDDCRKEIMKLQQEMQDEVKRFGDLLIASSNACEKVVVLEKKADNVIREPSTSARRLSEETKAFCPCCWRLGL